MQQKPSERPVAALTFAAAVALSAAGYVGSASGVPTVRSPLPLITVLPMFWLWAAVGEAPTFRWVVEYGLPALMGPLLLLTWHPKLLRGTAEVPKRSVIGLLVLLALTVAHFFFGWEYGLKYQGQAYATALAVLNATALVAAWALLMFAQSRRLFESTLGAHVFVVAWLVWCGFSMAW